MLNKCVIFPNMYFGQSIIMNEKCSNILLYGTHRAACLDYMNTTLSFGSNVSVERFSISDNDDIDSIVDIAYNVSNTVLSDDIRSVYSLSVLNMKIVTIDLEKFMRNDDKPNLKSLSTLLYNSSRLGFIIICTINNYNLLNKKLLDYFAIILSTNDKHILEG